MQTTAEVRACEWDAVRVRYPHSGSGYVTYVYCRRTNRSWEPWLVVCDSALLAGLGINQLGLYAARRFASGDLVGKYGGNVVGTFPSRDAAMRGQLVQRLVRSGVDTLLVVRSASGTGWDVLDATDAPPPSLQYANDPRGTPFGANVGVSEHGYMRVTASRGVPAFDLTQLLHANVQSELRFEYGDGYWALIDRVGSQDVPLEVG